MKELSIEQKAQRYDEALERAKDFMNGEAHYELKMGENIMCWVFPELRESEDDRIRKALIKYFKNFDTESLYTVGLNEEDILTWLEKQGEQKLPIEKLPEEMKTVAESLGFTTQEECDEYNQMVLDLIMSDDNEDEQKPFDYENANIPQRDFAPKVEPKCEENKTKIFDAPTPFEDKLYTLVEACEFLAIPNKKIEFILEHSREILDAAREQIRKEQKLTWSENEMKMLNNLITYLNGSKGLLEETKSIYIDWLKSLKQRIKNA